MRPFKLYFLILFTGCFVVSPLFTQNDYYYDIYRVHTKTGVIEQVTSIPNAGEYNASFSPNAKKIVHDVVTPASHDIYVTNVQNGVSTPLPGAEGGNDASWSPNGNWIAFDLGPVGDPSIYYVPAGGGTKILIKENAIDPHWSPNSQRVVFKYTNGGIGTINLNGSGETTIAKFGQTPVWSRNGQYIAFADDQGTNIYKVRVNNHGTPLAAPVNITNNNNPHLFISQPSWSNNSKTIAVAAVGPGYFDIQTFPANGGSLTVLADLDMFDDYDPCYSKNGQWVAFSGLTRPDALTNPPLPLKNEQMLTNFPNPFSRSTNIRFKILKASNVQINVYDNMGKLVNVLANEKYNAGLHQVKWNGEGLGGTPLPAGIYIYQLIAGNLTESHQMILLRN